MTLGGMSLDEQREWWNASAERNAMVAVLTDRLEWDEKEFYQAGVKWMMDHAGFALLSLVDLKGTKALDFGCGLGRMTLAWHQRYSNVIGVDISEGMLRRARENIQVPGVSFELVDSYPLPFADGTFELVYSTIVVQHISVPHNLRYVDEFFRVAAPSGYVFFDAPSSPLPNGEPSGDGIFMLPFDDVLASARAAGCRIVALRDFWATRTRHFQYLFQKVGV